MPNNDDFSKYRLLIMDKLKGLKENDETHTKQIGLLVHEVGNLKWKLLLVAILSGGLAGQAPNLILRLLAYVKETDVYASLVSLIIGG